jgi:putative methyltransferase (TIGR04325 family)
MKSLLKKILRRYLPAPLRASWLASRRVRYSGPYQSWAEAKALTTGYADPAILDRVHAATREVVAGRAAFERDSIVFAEPTPNPVLVAALTKQLQRAGLLRVLDFGGSLGSSYHQNRRFLPPSPPVEWHIVEQPHYAERGLAEFQTAELRFHHTIASACEAGNPDVVLVSSVLHYLDDPWAVLHTLAQIPAKCWLIERTPFGKHAADLPVIQHVPATIYRASYPAWILSHAKFTDFWAQNRMIPQWHPTEEGVINQGNLSFNYRTAVCARD